MKKRILIGLILFALGLTGIFSLLLVEIPLKSLPSEVLDKISPQTLKWIILINPAFFLITAIFLGVLSFNKVGLKLPIIGRLVNFYDEKIYFQEIIIYGIGLGTLSGILIVLVSYVFKMSFPAEFALLNQDTEMHIITRLLYGGITEEILTRFGLMSLFVYMFSLIFKSNPSIKYWLGIIVCSFLFGLGHLPMVYQLVGQPSISLVFYIIIGNFVAGIIFGWLYWKKGLESSMIGHMTAHLCMLTIGNLLPQ